MKIKVLRLLPLTLMLGMSMAMAQVNFTQTTTSDFMKGTGLNVNITDDCVSLQGKMTSFEDWGATTNMPQNLISHQVAVWRDYVYLVGGYNGTTEVNTVYRATQQALGLSSWVTLPALPVSLRDMAVVASQTHLFVIGGRNAEGVSNKIYQAALNDDGSIGDWQESPVSLPQPLWGMRAVMAMGNIYVIGGANVDDTNAASNKVYRLKLDADGLIATIGTTTNLPAARNGHAVAVYGSQIFVMGGYDATHTAKKAVYAATINLNGNLGSWSSKTSLPNPLYNHSAVCTNGIIAVMGGFEGSLPSNKCYYTHLDASTLTWTMSDIVMPERYMQGAAFSFGEKVFYCGGQNISDALNSYVRFMVVNSNGQMVNKASFFGLPFNVGAPKTMQQLNYTLNYTSSTISYEILYRVAGIDKAFGNWISAGSNLPVTLNQDYSHIQYMFRFTANGTDNLSLEDVTLTLTGISQLAGNMNDVSTIALEGSPYLVTEDISFTSGSHTIEAGVVIEFMPNTGMIVGRASMIFAGTESNPILLTSNGGETGKWKGVYFQDASDNGVSSTMNYTIIEKAGNGSNAANLLLENTNQPVITHCAFNLATANGMRLQNSAPSISESVMDGNGLAGIYYSSTNFNASLTNITCSNNLYGVWSCSPNRSFTYDGSDVTLENNVSDIAVSTGQINANQTWNYYANGYAVLGTLQIHGGTPKLTIAAGNTVKVKPDSFIYVGNNSSQGGMLYAVGTATAPITFTAYNGEIGGWNGLSFRDGSDYNSSSSLRYCVIEKAVNNVTCANTNQPGIMWSTIQDASNATIQLNSSNINIEESTIKGSTYGIYSTSSQPTLISDVIEGMSQACIWYTNTGYEPTFYSCTLKNSYLGIRYSTPNLNINNNGNVVFENNTCNYCVPEGYISDNCSWASNSYYISGSVMVGVGGSYNNGPDYCRLTLAPGATLKFAEGTNLHISYYYSTTYNLYRYYGELYAVGTAESPITFTSMNGEVGGWNGIRFPDESDNLSEQASTMKYCIIEKGNEYNIYLGSTIQPKQFEHCIIRESAGYGIYDVNSLVDMNDIQFENNNGYGLYYNDAYNVGTLENLTFSSNELDGVVIGGGSIRDDRIWNRYNYYILGDVIVGRGGSYNSGTSNTLTLSPGTTLIFAEGVKMQISNYSSSTYYYGNLYAVGTADAPITFTSMNGGSGGWNGLYFYNYCDNLSGMQSVLKFCIIEKGNEYNLCMSGTDQPSQIENCIISEGAGYGIWFSSSSPVLQNCQVLGNANYGIKCENSMIELHDVQIANNGNYAMYYNSAHYVGVLENVDMTGNLINGVAIEGGQITENRMWNNYNYYILNDVIIAGGDVCRLTLSPGTTLKFAEGAKMQISKDGYSFGELYAIGTEVQPITFTSMNGEVDGWNGLYFHNYSDYLSEQESALKYCIIEKGNEYNLYLENTVQPKQFEHCIIRESAGYGIYDVNSLVEMNDIQIENNTGYGLYYNDAHYVGALENLTFSGNALDGVVIAGGTIGEDRTWNAYNYYILGSIYVDTGGYNYHGPACRLTLSPGVTLKFAEETRMQISVSSYTNHKYLGELYAIGAVDAPITFTSMNGEVGGWDGLFFHDHSDYISEQESALKYCIIENANEYNLMLDNTNQPSLIENCQLINSNGYGISLVNSSPSIKKTTIRDNASYGLYLEGNSNPMVGGNYTNGCSIYRNNGGNGGYEVYHNGSANISMPYNFFGSIDSVYIDNALVYDKKEDNSKGRIDIKPNSWLPVNTEAFDWSGHLYYNGNTNKPLANCTIAIKDFQNVVQYQTTTNSDGYFSFDDIALNVASKIEAPLPLDNSGINSTDALAVMRHFTQLNPLEGAQLRAADVNDSKTVNGTDALLIQRRYIGSISSFPIGNAQITGEAMVSTGNDFESDLCVLKYGDVNGSLNVSREGGVLLLNEGELLVESHQTINLPVVVKNFDELGAVSLRFTYPEEYLEIENVTMTTESGNLAYQAEEGQLTISWYDINPLMLENGDLLLNISVMTKNLNMLETPIVFGVEAGSELADGQGIAINDAVIAMPSVITETLGLNGATHENAFAVAVYPNPMKDKAKIAYCLPSEGSVTLTVFNTMGNVVATLVDGQQACGFHQVELDSRQWASGVYYCRLTYGDVVKVMKMIVE